MVDDGSFYEKLTDESEGFNYLIKHSIFGEDTVLCFAKTYDFTEYNYENYRKEKEIQAKLSELDIKQTTFYHLNLSSHII